MNFTKTDEEATKILNRLYIRGYSFKDIFDVFNNKSLMSILLENIYKELKKTKRYIKNDSDDIYSCISKDSINIDNLLQQTINTTNKLKKLITTSESCLNLYIRLKNDILELKYLSKESYEKIIIPKDIKSCNLYLSLKNHDYKKLQNYKLEERLLINRDENFF